MVCGTQVYTITRYKKYASHERGFSLETLVRQWLPSYSGTAQSMSILEDRNTSFPHLRGLIDTRTQTGGIMTDCQRDSDCRIPKASLSALVQLHEAVPRSAT